MSRELFYKLVILFLLLLNLGVLGYLLLDKQQRPMPHGPGPRVDGVIIERLHLTDAQVEQFHELKHEHHTQMLHLQQASSQLHRELYAMLKGEVVDSVKRDSLMQLLQRNSLSREEVTYEHFRKLRGILTPEQVPAFDELVEDISTRIMGPHRGRP